MTIQQAENLAREMSRDAETGLPASETVLFAVRVGNEDWQEELITNNAEQIEAASTWAKANGFDRLRVATIDLTRKPDFRKALTRG